MMDSFSSTKWATCSRRRTTTDINIFTPPLSSASTVSQTITDASITGTIGAVLDASGNLIVSNGNNLAVFAPPFTAAPTVTPNVPGAFYRKIAISNSQLFVARVDGAGGIDVYNLPLTSASAPLFTMTNVTIPEAVAFDSSGNLYVGNASDATIRVFSPPFAAASTPSVTLTVGDPANFSLLRHRDRKITREPEAWRTRGTTQKRNSYQAARETPLSYKLLRT